MRLSQNESTHAVISLMSGARFESAGNTRICETQHRTQRQECHEHSNLRDVTQDTTSGMSGPRGMLDQRKQMHGLHACKPRGCEHSKHKEKRSNLHSDVKIIYRRQPSAVHQGNSGCDLITCHAKTRGTSRSCLHSTSMARIKIMIPSQNHGMHQSRDSFAQAPKVTSACLEEHFKWSVGTTLAGLSVAKSTEALQSFSVEVRICACTLHELCVISHTIRICVGGMTLACKAPGNVGEVHTFSIATASMFLQFRFTIIRIFMIHDDLPPACTHTARTFIDHP